MRQSQTGRPGRPGRPDWAAWRRLAGLAGRDGLTGRVGWRFRTWIRGKSWEALNDPRAQMLSIDWLRSSMPVPATRFILGGVGRRGRKRWLGKSREVARRGAASPLSVCLYRVACAEVCYLVPGPGQPGRGEDLPASQGPTTPVRRARRHSARRSVCLFALGDAATRLVTGRPATRVREKVISINIAAIRLCAMRCRWVLPGGVLRPRRQRASPGGRGSGVVRRKS